MMSSIQWHHLKLFLIYNIWNSSLKTSKLFNTDLNQLTMVEPTATPAAVEAICPNKPGPRWTCVFCGEDTLLGGLAAGTLEREDKPPPGEERTLDLPRGILFINSLVSFHSTDIQILLCVSFWHRCFSFGLWMIYEPARIVEFRRRVLRATLLSWTTVIWTNFVTFFFQSFFIYPKMKIDRRCFRFAQQEMEKRVWLFVEICAIVCLPIAISWCWMMHLIFLILYAIRSVMCYQVDRIVL